MPASGFWKERNLVNGRGSSPGADSLRLWTGFVREATRPQRSAAGHAAFPPWASPMTGDRVRGLLADACRHPRRYWHCVALRWSTPNRVLRTQAVQAAMASTV